MVSNFSTSLGPKKVFVALRVRSGKVLMMFSSWWQYSDVFLVQEFQEHCMTLSIS